MQRQGQRTSRRGPSRSANILYPLPQRFSTPPAPRSTSPHRNENQVAELTRLLDEQRNRIQLLTSENEALKKENEEVKAENANLKSWVEQNRPMYDYGSSCSGLIW